MHELQLEDPLGGEPMAHLLVQMQDFPHHPVVGNMVELQDL